jgi:hypothetical protein
VSDDLPVDAIAVREEVKTKYRAVAVNPHAGYLPYGTPVGAALGLQ